MNELARVLSMVGLVLLVAAPEGCVRKMGRSSMSASSGKRKITATMDGAASISIATSADNACHKLRYVCRSSLIIKSRHRPSPVFSLCHYKKQSS